jgi:hypothetical protein
MSTVPKDFPRPGMAGVSGAQPKLVGRMIHGRFVEGWTDEELLTRYEVCRNLAEQLTEYAKRKRAQMAELPLKEFLRRLRAGVVKKRWDIAAEELTWVMGRVAVAMGGGPKDVPASSVAINARAFDAPPYLHVDSVVDIALGRINGLDPVKR